MDMTLCIKGFRLPQWLSSKESACWAAGDAVSVPGSGRSPGGEYGNPLPCSFLESPIDRGVWWAAVQRVTKSWTRLKQLMTMHIKGLIWQIHLGPWEEVIWRRWHLVDWHTGPACTSPSPLSLECAFCPSFLQWEVFPKTTQAVLREQLDVENHLDGIHAWTWLSEWSRSVVSDSLQPHGLYPTRLLHPWNFLGKSTGAGCHFLL